MPRQRPVVHNRELGDYFRDFRRNRGWSLSRAVLVAKQRRLPVTRGALRWLEGGLTKNPEPELLRALSVLYGEPYENIVQEVARHVFDVKLQELRGDTPAASAHGFIALPLLATPITAGQPLLLHPDPEHDSSLSFRQDFAKKFTRPVCLRVGRRQASMSPLIQPGDVVLIDQNITRRRHPQDGHIYAVNSGPLTGDQGGILQWVEVSAGMLILTADNPDKSRYPTRAFKVRGATLPDVLVGEVVWFGRSLGSGARR